MILLGACLLAENCHISQMKSNPSKPLSASLLRYSGSKTMQPLSSSTNPLCLGIPNLELKGDWKWAMG